MAIAPPSDPLKSVYCSKDCQVKSKFQSQGLLFSLEPPVPPVLALGMPQQDTASREAAQKAFISYINKNTKAVPLLAARFIARQVANESTKLMPTAGAQPPSDIPDTANGNYTVYDHIERLRYLEVNAPEEEIKILSQVLSAALPGLEQFITEERHATLLGKMAYNSYGVCFSDGRDDRVYFRIEIMHACSSSLHRSLSPQNDRKMSKKHGHLTGRRGKSVVVYISFQPMYVLLAYVIISSEVNSTRHLIHVSHLLALPSTTRRSSILLLIAPSRRGTRSRYLTSTLPNTLTKQPPMPEGAVAWN